jgi:hypothetical protein
MSNVIEVKDKEVVLARLITADGNWEDGLAFYSQPSDFIQVGTWKYDAGKELKAHIHNKVIRQVLFTQEVIYVKKGKIRAKIYNLTGKLISELTVGAGDTIVLLSGGHGYDIIENGTEVLEVKNGPYLGPEIDRVRI